MPVDVASIMMSGSWDIIFLVEQPFDPIEVAKETVELFGLGLLVMNDGDQCLLMDPKVIHVLCADYFYST
jgi:hypothetical protein